MPHTCAHSFSNICVRNERCQSRPKRTKIPSTQPSPFFLFSFALKSEAASDLVDRIKRVTRERRSSIAARARCPFARRGRQAGRPPNDSVSGGATAARVNGPRRQQPDGGAATPSRFANEPRLKRREQGTPRGLGRHARGPQRAWPADGWSRACRLYARGKRPRVAPSRRMTVTRTRSQR